MFRAMVVSGMTETQIRKCHERLERFLVDLLEPVGRSERRHWGAVYVRGLLLNGERKSVETDGIAFAGWKRSGHAAVHWAEPLGLVPHRGTPGPPNDGGVGAGGGLGNRRYGLPQTRRSLGRSGTAVLRHLRKDGQLPGRS